MAIAIFALRTFVVVLLFISTAALVYYAWRAPEAKQLKYHQDLTKILLQNYCIVADAFIADRAEQWDWESVVKESVFIVKLNQAINDTPGYPALPPQLVETCKQLSQVNLLQKLGLELKPAKKFVDYLKLVEMPQNEV
jgi:hypothetical protein